MDLGLNWVDLLIVAVLVLFSFEALGRTLLSELLDLLGFLLAFFLSFSYYNFLASFLKDQFQISHGLSLAAGFMLTWFLTETIFFILVKFLIHKLPKVSFKGEQILTIIPAFLKSLILMSLFLVILATFPTQPKIKKAVFDSKVGSFILNHAYRLEQPVKKVFGGISEESLTFLTIKPKTNESVDLGFKTDDFKVNEQLEKQMIELVNKERTSRGLKALVYNSQLTDIARGHSSDMFKRGYFSHYSPEGETVANRANKHQIEYFTIGENLAYAPTLELAHQGLMDSPGHRANILSEDYAKIGIGVMDGGIYGLMFTQVFSD